MMTARPFQINGIQWLTTRTHALLGDTMGLGKSMQAICAADEIDAGHVLIVAPKATMQGWARECDLWAGRPVTLITGAKQEIPEEGWVVLPWSRLAARREDVIAQQWDVVVIDEAHYGKSGKGADRAVAAFGTWAKQGSEWVQTKGATDVADRVWLLTGTPMPNRPVELLPLLKALKVSWAKRSKDYLDRYCAQPNRWTPSGTDYNGAKNLGELNDRLVADIMLRRTPEMVPGELPEIVRVSVPLAGCRATEAAERILSPEAREALRGWTGSDGLPAFEEMSAYRREMGDAKAAAVADWADDWLRSNGGQALVIFGHHQSFCDEVAKRLKRYDPIVAHGGNAADSKVRQGKVDAFAAATGDKHRVFVGTTGACGTGMNGLHKRTSVCAFGELEWTPGEHQQAEGRVRRLGGLGASCVAYYLTISGSLEAHIGSVYVGKVEVQAQVLDQTAPEVAMPPAQVVPGELPEEEQEVEYPVIDDPSTLEWGWTKDRRTGSWMIRTSHPGSDEWEGCTVTVTRRDGSNPQRKVLLRRVAHGDHNGGWSIWGSEDAPPTREEQEERDRRYARRRMDGRGYAVADTRELTEEELACARAAHAAAERLTACDSDGARFRNDIGWNKADGLVGRVVAATDPECWDAGFLAGARRLLRTYSRTQVADLWPTIQGEGEA